jgi:hypothetical protein
MPAITNHGSGATDVWTIREPTDAIRQAIGRFLGAEIHEKAQAREELGGLDPGRRHGEHGAQVLFEGFSAPLRKPTSRPFWPAPLSIGADGLDEPGLHELRDGVVERSTVQRQEFILWRSRSRRPAPASQ